MYRHSFGRGHKLETIQNGSSEMWERFKMYEIRRLDLEGLWEEKTQLSSEETKGNVIMEQKTQTPCIW